jgi:hypothetical protein
MIKTQVQSQFDTDDGRQWIKGLLHDEHIKDLRVVFTKKDGTERTMHATLVESRIPVEKQPKSQKEGSETAGSAIRVFDTEVEEWRSFRWDSITEIRFDYE